MRETDTGHDWLLDVRQMTSFESGVCIHQAFTHHQQSSKNFMDLLPLLRNLGSVSRHSTGGMVFKTAVPGEQIVSRETTTSYSDDGPHHEVST